MQFIGLPFKARIISQKEHDDIFRVIADRNNTSHNYDACAADEIAKKLPGHYATIKKILDAIEL